MGFERKGHIGRLVPVSLYHLKDLYIRQCGLSLLMLDPIISSVHFKVSVASPFPYCTLENDPVFNLHLRYMVSTQVMWNSLELGTQSEFLTTDRFSM